jgi:hypothetical protein
MQGDAYNGAQATINVWSPKVDVPSEFSLSQIWILAGAFTSDLNSIEAGWQVSHVFPHSFTRAKYIKLNPSILLCIKVAAKVQLRTCLHSDAHLCCHGGNTTLIQCKQTSCTLGARRHCLLLKWFVSNFLLLFFVCR